MSEEVELRGTGSRRRRRPREPSGGDVDTGGAELLAAALGRMPDAEEGALWASMSPTNRRDALVRIDLMRRWADNRGGLDAATAAERAGVGVKRFYQMASAWAKDAGLRSVGVFAAARPARPSKINSHANAALQMHLPAVVRDPDGGSVEARGRSLQALARRTLESRHGVDSKIRLPSRNVLRNMIEAEMRRQRDPAPLAARVALDFAATSLTRADGAPHVMFAALDRPSGLILGCAVGRAGDLMSGYVGAMSSLAEGTCWSGLPVAWADRASGIDVVVPFREGAEDAKAFSPGPGLPSVQPATAEPPGRYLRKTVGERIGRVQLHFARTMRDDAGETVAVRDRFTELDATIRLLDDVRRHNEMVAGVIDWPDNAVVGGGPPSDLLRAATAFERIGLLLGLPSG